MSFAVRRARAGRWLALCLCLLAGAVFAQAAAAERQLKAVYLYRFAGFVEWPAGAFGRADSPLLVGVAGDDQLAADVARLAAGRSVNGHPLSVRRLRRGDSPAGLHILFVGAADRADGAGLLAATRRQPVLTVTDSERPPGAMVNFVVARERLGFEVALAQVAPSRLRISARMLSVASRVSGES
jgi:hypothetical protein